MTSKAQILCGWCGIIFVVVMGVGLGPFAQMMPPPPPLISAAEIAAEFRQNATGILMGSFLANIAVALSIALVVGISVQIRRMESAMSPVLSYLQLAFGHDRQPLPHVAGHDLERGRVPPGSGSRDHPSASRSGEFRDIRSFLRRDPRSLGHRCRHSFPSRNGTQFPALAGIRPCPSLVLFDGHLYHQDREDAVQSRCRLVD